jgi:PAS domain S-box-containing protein
MEKEAYIRDELLKLTHYWTGVIFILGAFLFLLFGVVDYLVTPENFSRFFLLRAGVAVTLATLAFLSRVLNRRRISRIRLDLSIIAATVVAALAIELMILALGGHISFYYAGLSLVVISVLGIVPLSLTLSIICVGLIYLVYLAPIFLFDTITNWPLFISNNAFLTSTFIIALVWRSLEQKNLIKTLGLQYVTNSDKQKLKLYSDNLEHLVEERTKELNKSEQMLRVLFEHANDGIIIMDEKGTILNANHKACAIHGFDRDSFIEANIMLFETDENKPLMSERLRRILDGESLLFETEHYRKDGSKVALEISSRAIEVEGRVLIQSFLRDVTEKKKLQSQLLHSQRMDSIGHLAGGLSHDFNNILTSILGLSELVLEKADLDDYTADKLRLIEKAGRQGSQIVSKLLSFARKSNFESLPFDLNSVINDTMGMLARLMPRQIQVVKRLREPLPLVEGDVGQMEQVIMNLAINARDAMSNGGELNVASDIVPLGSGDIDIEANVESGQYVNITVSDTGEGIAAEHIPHIFEPFFTTKEKGKGTGLGLAMVYGIVKEHKGYITAESTPGRGTTFNVYIPTSKSRAAGAGEPEYVKVRGSETILVIDDEAAILEFVKEVLSDRGFQVITASSPVQGLEIYEKAHRDIDLVITDMIMPALYGRPVVEKIRELNPKAKIVAITGFSDALDNVNVDKLIKKPFNSRKLLSTVGVVLGRYGISEN